MVWPLRAKRVVSQRPCRLISSDLARCWMTALAIAQTTCLDIEPSALLHERNFGDLRGVPYDSLGFDPLVAESIPGGESREAFRQRVNQAFAMMLERLQSASDTIVVVTHGLVIRGLLDHHLSLPAATNAPERLRNTSVTIFAGAPPYQVSLLDDTSHLDSALDDDGHSLSGG